MLVDLLVQFQTTLLALCLVVFGVLVETRGSEGEAFLGWVAIGFMVAAFGPDGLPAIVVFDLLIGGATIALLVVIDTD